MRRHAHPPVWTRTRGGDARLGSGNTSPFLWPLVLLLGLALGWLMMRQIRFWRDEATGQVWMGGGLAYVAIWLAIVALRLGVEYAAGGFSAKAAPRAPTTLSLLASDLLILSIGLWLARGYALVRRAQQYGAP